jgi:hypothetical protein
LAPGFVPGWIPVCSPHFSRSVHASDAGGRPPAAVGYERVVGFCLINGFARGIAFDALGKVAVVTREATEHDAVLFLR